MARRRNAARYRPFWLVAAGLLLTGLLAGGIQLGITITKLRVEVKELARDCENEAAHLALVSVRWNTESSRQVVMRRAQDELALVCPDAPSTIRLAAGRSPSEKLAWSGVLKRLEPRDDALPGAVAATVRP